MITYLLDLIDKWFPQKEICTEENTETPLISEPVISMVEYFKVNYRDFYWYFHETRKIYSVWYYYTFVDNNNRISYTARIGAVTLKMRDFYIDGKEIAVLLTPEEKAYIVEEVFTFLKGREKRLAAIKLQRASRSASRKREELLKIYCD